MYFCWLILCCLLWIVLCLMLLSVASSAIHNYLFVITLQEKIGTVTVEGVENVGEEVCIEIKTEQPLIQLVRVIKTEQQVSVLCSE